MDDSELFELAMDLPEPERLAALRAACPGEPARVRRLLELVGMAEHSESTGAAEPPLEPDPEPEHLRPGDRIDRYAIERFLGQGSFGRVYEALDPELHRRVALKLLHREHGETERERDRFRQEARNLAQIDHPNVVRVYDVGEHEGQMFLTMELVAGQTLRKWMSAAPHDWRAVLEVLAAAARGLQAAHAVGIVHRDFKPGNVMLDATGRVVVMDFGVARTATTGSGSQPTLGVDRTGSTLTRSALGTPRYMAPEQFRGQATAASDQLAWCRVLLEGLGLDLDAGDDPSRVVAPAWVRALAIRGLAPEPEQRHPDMQAILDIIARHHARRRWWVRSLVTGLLAVSVAGLVRPQPSDPCAQWSGDAIRRELGPTWVALDEATNAAPAPDVASAQLASLRARVERDLDEWAEARAQTCEQHAAGVLDADTARVRDDCFVAWRSTLSRRLERASERPTSLGGVHLSESLPRNPSRCRYRNAPLAAQPPVESTQREEIESRLDRAWDLRIEGDYRAGMEVAREALAMARGLGHEGYQAETLHRLGVLAARLRDSSAALELLHESAQIAERLGLDGLAVEVYANLAETLALSSSAPSDEARHYLALARAKADRRGGRDDALDPELWTIEGHLKLREGAHEEAASAYRTAVERFEARNGPDDDHAAAARSNLARVLSRQGRHEEALALATEALDARTRVLGAEHPLIVADRLALGLLHVRAASAASSPERARAELMAAESELDAAVLLGRRAYGPRSTPVATALAERVDVILRRKEIDRLVAREVLDFVEVHVDPDNLDVTEPQRDRALRIALNAFHALRRWDDARRIAATLVQREHERRPPPGPHAEGDELLLVSYEIQAGLIDDARQRLQAHEARHRPGIEDDPTHRARVEALWAGLRRASETQEQPP